MFAACECGFCCWLFCLICSVTSCVWLLISVALRYCGVMVSRIGLAVTSVFVHWVGDCLL